MKKQLLTLLLTAASLAGYADVPAGLPETLPSGVVGYELVTDAGSITAGEQYVIRATFAAGATAPDAVLVLKTIDGTVYSKLVTISDITTADDVSSMYWTAEDTGNSTYPVALSNSGYYCIGKVTSGIGGHSDQSDTGVFSAATTTTSIGTTNMFSFIAGTSESTAQDGITARFWWKVNSDWFNMDWYNATSGYTTHEFAGGSSSPDWSNLSWTRSSEQYYITDFFAIYHVLRAYTDDELSQYKGYLLPIQSIDETAYNKAVADIEAAESFSEMQQITLSALNVAYADKYITLKNQADGSSQYMSMTSAGMSAPSGKDLNSWWHPTFAANTDGNLTVLLNNAFANTNAGNSTAPTRSGQAGTSDDGFAFTWSLIDGNWLFQDDTYYLNTNTTINTVVYWDGNGSDDGGAGTGSQWAASLVDADDLTSATSLARTDVEKATATAYSDSKVIGTDLGEYTDQFQTYRDAFIAICDGGNATFNEIVAAYREFTTIRTSTDTRVLNMPVAGSYIRVKASPACLTFQSATGPLYLTCVNSASGSSTANIVSSINSDENLLNTILYYTGETLSGYSNGLYLTATAGSTLHALEDITASPLSISIDASTAEAGAYLIDYAGTSTSRPICFLYILNSGVTGCGNAESLTNLEAQTYAGAFHVQLEYVEELPVTVGTDGTATLCVPVAVTIPEGADCYAAVVNNGKTLRLASAPAGTSYAAHTAIFIKGTAGQIVKFPIASSGEETYVCDEFRGNAVKSSFTAQDGKVTYAPAAKPSTTSLAPGMRRVEASGTSVYFAKASDTLDANTPILTLDQATLGSTDAVEAFEVEVKDGETVKLELTVTSVSELTAEQPADNAPVYDLMGRRVLNPQHGLFIMNGKIFRK